MRTLAFATIAALNIASSPAMAIDWENHYASIYGGAFHQGTAGRANQSGPVGGITFGSRKALPSGALVGLEADLAWSANYVEYPASNDAVTFYAPSSLRLSIALPMGDWLPYVATGPAVGAIRLEDWSNGNAYDMTRLTLGAVVAVGVDHAVSDNLFVRAELSAAVLKTIENFVYPSSIPGLTWNYGATSLVPQARIGLGMRW